jgi:hypothetical protein
MTLLEYCIESIKLLDTCEVKDFAALYMKRRIEVYNLYSKGLICSTAHGIEYFHNVIKYIDCPEEYKETEKGKAEYETNFRKILTLNK